MALKSGVEFLHLDSVTKEGERHSSTLSLYSNLTRDMSHERHFVKVRQFMNAILFFTSWQPAYFETFSEQEYTHIHTGPVKTQIRQCFYSFGYH